MPFKGASPSRLKAKSWGGVGVSGGSGEQDIAISLAAAAIIT
jgi:uncharacterized protein GlcG (DUF336 family)